MGNVCGSSNPKPNTNDKHFSSHRSQRKRSNKILPDQHHQGPGPGQVNASPLIPTHTNDLKLNLTSPYNYTSPNNVSHAAGSSTLSVNLMHKQKNPFSPNEAPLLPAHFGIDQDNQDMDNIQNQNIIETPQLHIQLNSSNPHPVHNNINHSSSGNPYPSPNDGNSINSTYLNNLNPNSNLNSNLAPKPNLHINLSLDHTVKAEPIVILNNVGDNGDKGTKVKVNGSPGTGRKNTHNEHQSQPPSSNPHIPSSDPSNSNDSSPVPKPLPVAIEAIIEKENPSNENTFNYLNPADNSQPLHSHHHTADHHKTSKISTISNEPHSNTNDHNNNNQSNPDDEADNNNSNVESNNNNTNESSTKKAIIPRLKTRKSSISISDSFNTNRGIGLGGFPTSYYQSMDYLQKEFRDVLKKAHVRLTIPQLSAHSSELRNKYFFHRFLFFRHHNRKPSNPNDPKRPKAFHRPIYIQQRTKSSTKIHIHKLH